jgi:hypothetical protein
LSAQVLGSNVKFAKVKNNKIYNSQKFKIIGDVRGFVATVDGKIIGNEIKMGDDIFEFVSFTNTISVDPDLDMLDQDEFESLFMTIKNRNDEYYTVRLFDINKTIEMVAAF